MTNFYGMSPQEFCAAFEAAEKLPNFGQAQCGSIHWYEGDTCVLAHGHEGEHRDFAGLTWDKDASPDSVYRK
jgi:hypothetical protein